MSNPLVDKKFRISIKETVSNSLWGSVLDIDDLDELKAILRDKKVSKLSLKSTTIIDDIPDWHEAGISVDDLTQAHFEWLTTKSYGESKYLEIDNKTK